MGFLIINMFINNVKRLNISLNIKISPKNFWKIFRNFLLNNGPLSGQKKDVGFQGKRIFSGNVTTSVTG